MNELVNGRGDKRRDGSYHVGKVCPRTGTYEKEYTISAFAMQCLQPDIDQRKWDIRVDAEAKRRLETERFETAVQKRMQELKTL